MRKLWWGILVLGCMGCVSGEAIYKETYNTDGTLLSIESGVIDYWAPWGAKSDIRNIEVDQKNPGEWTLKGGAEIESDQGEAADIIGGLLEAFKLGLSVGSGIPPQ